MTFLAYTQGIPSDDPVVTWYAIFILTGALLALFLASYRAHKDGYEWSFFLTVFMVGFPLGIVGARVWYVIASWDEFANRAWYSVFEIWKGGLAIQGGVIFGVVAGLLFMFFRRKGTSVLKALDFAVPTILIAQAIGRWGNFFNQEVFGHAVSLDAWSFLPSFITNNMQNGSSYMLSGVKLPSDSIAAPLFLIEGMINIMCYFLITRGIPAIEGKHYRNGDQTFAYFFAYGLVRLCLEPLRNPQFIMGSDASDLQASQYNSLNMAIVFIVVGALLIAGNHILGYLADKGKLDNFKPYVWLRDRYSNNTVITLKTQKETAEVEESSAETPAKQTETTSVKEERNDIDLNKLREFQNRNKEDERNDGSDG